MVSEKKKGATMNLIRTGWQGDREHLLFLFLGLRLYGHGWKIYINFTLIVLQLMIYGFLKMLL